MSNQSFTDCKTDIVNNCSDQLCQEPADTDMDSPSGEAAESREVSAPVAGTTPGPLEDLSGGTEAT